MVELQDGGAVGRVAQQLGPVRVFGLVLIAVVGADGVSMIEVAGRWGGDD